MNCNNDEGDWTTVGKNGKQKFVKDLTIEGLNFQSHRPNDTIMDIDNLDDIDDVDDIHQELIKLENPLFWSECALIGNIEYKVTEILINYQINPKGQIMKLLKCIQTINRNITQYDLKENFDNTMETLGQKIIFLSVIPRFTKREYGNGKEIYLIHIRFDNYLIADSNCVPYDSDFLIGYNEFYSFLGNTYTHIPQSKEQESKENSENFMKIMKILKDKRQYEYFQPNYDGIEDPPEKILERNSTKVPYYKFEKLLDKDKIFKCKLFLEDIHSGYGEILEGSKKRMKIYLHNRRNCWKAFSGDIVEILLFKQNKMDKRDNEENNQFSGRVISVISSEVKPINKIFLCHLLFGTTNLMAPICNTIPVIHVDNNDAIELVREHNNNLRTMEVVGNENIIQSKINKKHAKPFANKTLVTLKHLDVNLMTSINKVYHVDCYSCEFIFLVLYRKWDNYHRFPHGEVVGIYTPDAEFENTLNLIKVSCDIPVIGIDEEQNFYNEVANIKILKMKDSKISKEIVNNNTDISDTIFFSFKQPNKEYNEIAFSHKKLTDSIFEIGVHVTNVCKYIRPNEFLDIASVKHFFTFLLPNIKYSKKTTVQPHYLLSKALSTEYLSINLENPTDVISFYFKIENEIEIVDKRILINEKIILNLEINVEKSIENCEYLESIFRFCFNYFKDMQYVLPADWFYPNFKLKFDYHAYFIGEVLKQITNKEAAVEYSNLQNDISTDLNDWYREIKGNYNVSLSPLIKKVLRTIRQNFKNNNSPGIRVSKQFLENILNNSRTNLFRCESLFPDIGFYHKKFQLITNEKIKNYLEKLNFQFLSVTNPLSCYMDIFTQRVLLDRINGLNITHDVDEYFDKYKSFKVFFDKYWRICRAYEIKYQFNGNSFILDCVFDDFSEEKINFHHPFLNEVNCDNFILFRLLGLNKVPIETSNDGNSDVILNWKTRIFINTNDNYERFQKISEINLKDIYSYDCKVWRYQIIRSKIESEDIDKIKKILDNDSYPDRLTSEIIENINPMMTINYPIRDKQLMRVQFTYDYSSGIMRIVPELLIINSDFRICLGHRNDPLKYFMHPKETTRINYKRFEDISEYKSQFIILNRLEGIHQTIGSNSSFSIHDLKIDWIAKKSVEADKEDIYGIVIMNKSWCQSRFLKLTHDRTNIRDPCNAFHEAVKKHKMDYLLCIQTFIKDENIYWVGHGRVCDICLLNDKDISVKNLKKNEKDFNVHLTFKLIHSSFPIRNLENQLYLLEFMESPISSRIFERSLRKLKRDTFSEQLVIEKKRWYYQPDETNLDFELIQESMVFKCNLNLNQKKALRKSAKFKFTLIWGPPGTGKTLVGCMIAFWYTWLNRQVNTKSKTPTVLYCGPSNQSVNVVAEKLMKTFGPKCPKLLRVFNSEVVYHDFPCKEARCDPDSDGCPDILKDIALHFVVRESKKPYAEKLKDFQEIFSKKINRNQMKRHEFVKIFQNYESCLKKAFNKEIQSGEYEIILTTAAGSCKKLFEKVNFAQIILDECGMCTEPEALGPTINKNELKHLVLIGDHKQLRPIVTSQIAKGKHLNMSLFERLYKPKEEYCVMLDTQYRMHPSICEFPSAYFYKNNIRNTQDVFLTTAVCESWTGIPDIKHDENFNGLQYVNLYSNYEKDLKRNNINIADDFWNKGGRRRSNFKCLKKDIDFSGPPVYEKILFIHAQGQENNQVISCNTGSNQSKSNDLEANIVGDIYSKLVKRIVPKETASQSILVITQYRLQEYNLNKICQSILKKNGICGSPRVSTVVKSQGSESDYVIFSTVRSLPNVKDIDENPSSGWISKYLGFITDENQFNVALTRAKKGLFIVGNSDLLSVHEMWKSFITDLKNRKCFIEDMLELL